MIKNAGRVRRPMFLSYDWDLFIFQESGQSGPKSNQQIQLNFLPLHTHMNMAISPFLDTNTRISHFSKWLHLS